jgi:hypothetical protein
MSNSTQMAESGHQATKYDKGCDEGDVGFAACQKSVLIAPHSALDDPALSPARPRALSGVINEFCPGGEENRAHPAPLPTPCSAPNQKANGWTGNLRTSMTSRLQTVSKTSRKAPQGIGCLANFPSDSNNQKPSTPQ